MGREKIQIYFFLITLLAIAILTFRVFLPFFNILVLAAILAFILQPLYRKALLIFKNNAGVSALFVIIVVAIFIITPLVFLGIRIFQEAQGLYPQIASNSADYIQKIASLLQEPLQKSFPQISSSLQQYTTQLISWVIENLGPLVSGTINVVLDIFLIIISLYYFLKDGPKFKNALIKISPLEDKYDNEILEKLETTINSVVKGTLLVAIAQGVLTGLGLLIFGVANATLWGSIAAFSSLIPGIGTALVWVPAVVYLLITNNLVAAAGLFIWGAIIVGLVDNLLRPFLYGKGTKTHPLLVLFSVLGGFLFFGPLGFLLGPTVLSFCFALLHIYHIIILKTKTEQSFG